MLQAFLSNFSCILYFTVMFSGQSMESLTENEWRRIRFLAKWVCVKCFKLKEAVVFDWMVLPCDHLVCLACFKARANDLKNLYECGCGQTFDGLSAFEYLRRNSSLAFEAAQELSS